MTVYVVIQKQRYECAEYILEVTNNIEKAKEAILKDCKQYIYNEEEPEGDLADYHDYVSNFIYTYSINEAGDSDYNGEKFIITVDMLK